MSIIIFPNSCVPAISTKKHQYYIVSMFKELENLHASIIWSSNYNYSWCQLGLSNQDDARSLSSLDLHAWTHDMRRMHVFVQELELEKEEAEMVRCSPSKECWMGYDILALQWGWEDLKREPCKAQLQLRWYGLCRISESWPDMQPSRAHWIHPWAPVAIKSSLC